MSTAADRIARVLTVEILRGVHPVGHHLPTVRALARRFEVTPATLQRALAQLARSGLVASRQGSGTTVLDPLEAGDLSLVPAWLEATSDDPPRAAALLADFLEVRRVLAARLLVRHREALLAALPALAEAAASVPVAGDLDALREADLGFARALVRHTGNTVVLAVLNTASEVLSTTPCAAEAMYAEPATNAASMGEILAALVAGAADLADTIERSIERVDAATVARFEALLTERAR